MARLHRTNYSFEIDLRETEPFELTSKVNNTVHKQPHTARAVTVLLNKTFKI